MILKHLAILTLVTTAAMGAKTFAALDFGVYGNCEISDARAQALGYPIYNLAVGQRDYVNPTRAAKPSAVKFKNSTGRPLQLNFMLPIPAANYVSSGSSVKWGETCVYLDQYQQYPSLVDPSRTGPGQGYPGGGEVGCITKLSTEPVYTQPIRWGTDAQPTALAIPPGSCLVIGGQENYNFRLNVSEQTRGLAALRMPSTDEIIRCNGALQSTPARVYRNTTGRNLRLTGATIYAATIQQPAVGHNGAQVTYACIRVLNSKGAVKYNFCSPDYPVHARGPLNLPNVTVLPNESVVAQAQYVCPANVTGIGNWGWAAWLHMY